MWELQRVWWTDFDVNWRKTHILTSSWVKFWGEMSPQCGLSCGHLPPRTSPIWIYLTPTTRTDQHHHNQHSLQLLSISSHFWPGETTEILSFFLFYESAKALDDKTRSCGHIQQDHAQLCAVTLTVTLQTCCHPLGQQTWFSLNQQSIKLSMLPRLW